MEGRKQILVIDDNQLIREALCSELETDGFDVIGCHNGKSGLTAAHERSFDVVITDYRMPLLTGVEVTRILRERFPALLIIGVSSDNKAEDFLDAGANAFLWKPYKYDELLELISQKNCTQLPRSNFPA